MDIDFIGYVIKIGNYYFGGRTKTQLAFIKKHNEQKYMTKPS